MKANFKRIMRHPIMFSRALSPFTLSHHPDCRPYSHHCFNFRGHRLCIGCFIGFPTTIGAFLALVIASWLGLQLGFLDVLFLGFSIEATAFLIKVLHFSKRVSVRVGLKIVQAVGVGFWFFVPLTLQAPLLLELLVVFMLYMAANTIVGAVRVYETEKTCGACEYKGNWSKCPGFKKVTKRLYEAGFLTA